MQYIHMSPLLLPFDRSECTHAFFWPFDVVDPSPIFLLSLQEISEPGMLLHVYRMGRCVYVVAIPTI